MVVSARPTRPLPTPTRHRRRRPPPPPPPSIALSLSIDTAAVSLLDGAGRAVATLELDRAAARARADAAGAARARARVGRARVLGPVGSAGAAPPVLLTLTGAAAVANGGDRRVAGSSDDDDDDDDQTNGGAPPPALFLAATAATGRPLALRVDAGAVEARPSGAAIAALTVVLAEAAGPADTHASRAAAAEAAALGTRAARAAARAARGAAPPLELRLGVADIALICAASHAQGGPSRLVLRTGGVGVDVQPPPHGGRAAAAAATALLTATAAGEPAARLDELAVTADAARSVTVALRAAALRVDWAARGGDAAALSPALAPLPLAARLTLGRAGRDATAATAALDAGAPIRVTLPPDGWGAAVAAVAAALPPRAPPRAKAPPPACPAAVAAAATPALAACAASLFAEAPPAIDVTLRVPRLSAVVGAAQGAGVAADAGRATARARAAPGCLAVDFDTASLRLRDTAQHTEPPPVWPPGAAVPRLAAGLATADAAVCFSTCDSGALLVSLDLHSPDVASFPGDPAGYVRAAALGARARARVTHAQRWGQAASTAVALEGLALGGSALTRLAAVITTLVAKATADGTDAPPPQPTPDTLALDFERCSVTLPAAAPVVPPSDDGSDAASPPPPPRHTRLQSIRVTCDRLAVCLPAAAPPPLASGAGCHAAVARSALPPAGSHPPHTLDEAPPAGLPSIAPVLRVSGLELRARVAGWGRRSDRPRLACVRAARADVCDPRGALYTSLALVVTTADVLAAPLPLAALRGALETAAAAVTTALPRPPPTRVGPPRQPPPSLPRPRLVARLASLSASFTDDAGAVLVGTLHGARADVGGEGGPAALRVSARGASLHLTPPRGGRVVAPPPPPSAAWHPSGPLARVAASDGGGGSDGGSTAVSRAPSVASAADVGLAAALAPPLLPPPPPPPGLGRRRRSMDTVGEGRDPRARAASTARDWRPPSADGAPTPVPTIPASPLSGDGPDATSDAGGGYETARSSSGGEEEEGQTPTARAASPPPGPPPASARWRASSAPPGIVEGEDQDGGVAAASDGGEPGSVPRAGGGVALATVAPRPRRRAARGRAARLGFTLAEASVGGPVRAALGGADITLRVDGGAWAAGRGAFDACAAALAPHALADAAAALVAAAAPRPDPSAAAEVVVATSITPPSRLPPPLAARAGTLALTLVAPTAAGLADTTPSARLTLLAASLHRDVNGAWSVALPGAEAAVWAGGAPPRAPRRGRGVAAASLAAARGLTATLCPSGGGGLGPSLDVALDGLSVWLCPARAVALAALATAARAPAAAAAERAGAPTFPNRRTPPPSLPSRLTLDVTRAGILLETAPGRGGVPLLEAAVAPLTVSIAAVPQPLSPDADARTLPPAHAVTAAAHIGARAYAAGPGAWEPVLDPPWPVEVAVSAAPPPDMAPSAGGRAAAVVRSAAVAELTAAPAALRAVAAVRDAVALAAAGAAGGPALDAALADARRSAAAAARAVAVTNATGVPLTLALAPAQGAPARAARRPPALPVDVDPGASVALPLAPPADRHGGAAGAPRAALRVGAPPPAPRRRAPRPPPPLALHATLGGATRGAVLPPVPLASPCDGVADTAPPPGGAPARAGWRVGARPGGAATVLLHSCLRIVNTTGRTLDVGLASALGGGVDRVATLAPAARGWLPAVRPEPGLLVLRPFDSSYEWSAGVRLAPLLDAATAAEGGATARRAQPPTPLVARVLSLRGDGAPDVRLRLGLARPATAAGGGWDVVVAAPLTILNATPLPLAATLGAAPSGARAHLSRLASSGGGAGASPGAAPSPPLALAPGACARVDGPAAYAPGDADVVLQPAGFAKAAPAPLPAPGGWSVARLAPPPRLAAAGAGAPGSLSLPARGGRAAALTLRLEATACPASGALTVRVCAPAAARNWAGVPLAFALDEPASLEGVGGGTPAEPPTSDTDAPPDAWVPSVGGGGGPVRRAAPAAMRVASRATLDGLGHALGGGGGGSSASLASGGGSADSLAADTPTSAASASRHRHGPSTHFPRLPPPTLLAAPPSLAAGAGGARRRAVAVRLRAGAAPAPPGRGSAWSSPAVFDPDTGGAAVVAVPAGGRPPMAAGGGGGAVAPVAARATGAKTATLPPRGAYLVALEASPAPGGGLAFTTSPRFVVRSDLPPGGPDLQFCQEGAPPDAARALPPGAARVVHWHDVDRPLRLVLRPREAGWAWSGGLDPSRPGDSLLRVRSREGAPPRLLRVTVAPVGGGGCLAAAAEFVGDGFAPYRVDNCSACELRIVQAGAVARGAAAGPSAPGATTSSAPGAATADAVRPWSSAPYAWDAPAGDRTLVVALADGPRVGAFALDSVSPSPTMIALPASAGGALLRVSVIADGPVRVLNVVDARVHAPAPRALPSSSSPADGGGGSVPWAPWWTPAPALSARAAAAALGVGAAVAAPIDAGWPAGGAGAPPPRGWCAVLDLAGVGASLVDAGTELAYARAVRVRVAGGEDGARGWCDAAVGALQVDDARPTARARVPLALPAPVGWGPASWVRASASRACASGSTTTTAADADTPSARARVAVWRRRPGGVLCVDVAEVALDTLALDVDVDAVTVLVGAARRAAAATRGGGGGDASDCQSLDHLTPPPDAPPPLVADTGPWPALAATPPAPELKVYADRIAVSPLTARLSLHPAGGGDAPPPHTPAAAHAAARAPPGRARARAVAALLGEVEGARVRLAPLTLHHPLLSACALASLAGAHYARAALPQLVAVVGSASVLGDPLALVRHVGLSLWSLAGAAPAAAAAAAAAGRFGGPPAEPAAAFATRLAAGVVDAASHAAYGVSNAAAKAAAAARAALDAAGVAPPTAAGGGGGVLAAVAAGLAGLIVEPVRGADAHGVRGVLTGAARGAVGAVAGPAAAALDAAAALAASVRAAVSGDRALHRVRPPRVLPVTGGALPPYDWNEAAGRELLAEVGEGGERFVAARAVAPPPPPAGVPAPPASSETASASSASGLCFVAPPPPRAPAAAVADATSAPPLLALITTDRIVLAPGPRAPRPREAAWSAAAVDVVGVAVAGARVTLLAVAPDAAVGRPRGGEVSTSRRHPTARPPLASATVCAATPADADALAAAVRSAARSARARRAAVVTRPQLAECQGVRN